MIFITEGFTRKKLIAFNISPETLDLLVYV